MSTIGNEDGGPAFPSNGATFFPGMPMRDYFAAKALAALIAEPPFSPGARSTTLALTNNSSDDVAGTFAKAAYLLADAMLKERQS